MSVHENDRVTVEDFDTISVLVLDSWITGVDLDWSVPAGTLEWSCLYTADHVIDCVFSYALSSRHESSSSTRASTSCTRWTARRRAT